MFTRPRMRCNGQSAKPGKDYAHPALTVCEVWHSRLYGTLQSIQPYKEGCGSV